MYKGIFILQIINYSDNESSIIFALGYARWRLQTSSKFYCLFLGFHFKISDELFLTEMSRVIFTSKIVIWFTTVGSETIFSSTKNAHSLCSPGLWLLVRFKAKNWLFIVEQAIYDKLSSKKRKASSWINHSRALNSVEGA